MPSITLINTPPTMSSREIAELTGKRHSHVMRDIEVIISSSDTFYARKQHYSHQQNGQQYQEFILSGESVSIVIARYRGLARIPLSLQEKAALKTIEQVLGITLKRQYCVGKYRIDGYDVQNNVAYEIDEMQHKYNKGIDIERQAWIERELGCRFVRVEV